MSKRALAFIAVLSSYGCVRSRPQQSFSHLAEDFVYGRLSLSPITAALVGYHRSEAGNLDEMLDDVSEGGIDHNRKFYVGFRERLAAIKPEKLSPEERADYDIISDQISLALLEFDRIQSYRYNPTIYVEAIGNALFTPYVLEYAPKPQRIRHIIRRLEKLPLFFEQARKNLTDSPQIWITVASEENEGNIGLIDKTIRSGVPSDLRDDYDHAAMPALEAARRFQEFLKNALSKPTQIDWRLGREKYGDKFRYTLATDLTPEQVLASAEADLKTVRARMLDLALPLHRQMYTAHQDHADLSGAERENRVISETLARIADRHSTPENYISDAKRDLEQARQFVQAKNLLTLPPRNNLQVIETPEFVRGIYAVGGFVSGPALEPELGAFYWITPIPKTWPAKRVESKLREYNFFSLQLLTIHEAMPGHYVQLEYANDIQPKARRVLRSVFGNGPYVEGWAVYATQMMLDEGYLDGAPELRLTFQKQELRVLANAILDIRLHTQGMNDQQALELMEKQTFQENEEATAKLRRAKLSSCQLPTYLVGWRDWMRLREHYKSRKGKEYELRAFHDSALKEGAVPLPVLSRLLTGTTPGETPSR